MKHLLGKHEDQNSDAQGLSKSQGGGGYEPRIPATGRQRQVNPRDLLVTPHKDGASRSVVACLPFICKVQGSSPTAKNYCDVITIIIIDDEAPGFWRRLV